jgi:hypothetical protein
MISAHEIRRSPFSTKLFFIIAPSLAILAFFSSIMPKIVDAYYSNMIAGFTDTIHAAPAQYAGYALIGDVIVLVFCLLFFGAWLGSEKIEGALEG